MAPIWHKIEEFEELPFHGHWLLVLCDLGRQWLGLLVLLFVGVLALGDYLIHRLVTRTRLWPAIYWAWFIAVAVAGLAALGWGADLFNPIFPMGRAV
jgi:hypothetical protein